MVIHIVSGSRAVVVDMTRSNTFRRAAHNVVDAVAEVSLIERHLCCSPLVEHYLFISSDTLLGGVFRLAQNKVVAPTIFDKTDTLTTDNLVTIGLILFDLRKQRSRSWCMTRTIWF